jgi:hypothetical protein
MPSGIKTNRFNDPAWAQTAMNVASLFAPPSAADAANYALAAERKQKIDQLAQLFANPNDPLFDKRNIAVGNYAPTQSFEALRTEDATKRFDIQTDAETALAERRLQEQGAFARQIAEPVILDPGQLAHLPAQTSAGTGLAPTLFGAPKPLSETEMKAIILSGLPPEEQRAAALSDVDWTDVVTPEGPRIAMEANSEGLERYFNQGAEAKPTNGLAVINGQQVAVVQRPDNSWVEAQTGTPIPAGIPVYDIPKPQGTAEEIGLGKPAQNDVQKRLIDIRLAKDTATTLRNKIAESPASQGAVGWLRGTAQNVIQTGGELGTYFGGGVADVNNAIASGLADADLAGSFDVNIPAIEMLSNLLAFQYAKTTTGERLSNEMLRTTKTALGLDGLTANQASSIARLNQAIERIESQEQILADILGNGLGTGGGTSATAVANGTTTTGELPVMATPEQASALPSGTRFKTPDGRVLEVP